MSHKFNLENLTRYYIELVTIHTLFATLSAPISFGVEHPP